MAVRVKITGGKGPSAFPWGTVPRKKTRTYDLEDYQLGIVETAKDRGFISDFEVVGAAEVRPAVFDEPAEDPVVEEASSEEPADPAAEASAEEAADDSEEEVAEKHDLADLYEATLGKPLTKAEPNRKELVKMYEAVFGEHPGKKYSSTVTKELVNATRS